MDGKSGNLVTCMRAAWKVAFIAAIALAAALPVGAHAADGLPPVPPAGKRLTDLAKAINAPEQTKLIGKLKELEEKTGAQVAVLVVETTQPLAMEEYAIRVFDAWKLGQANINNGLLILVSTADKKVRIEVGRGLEGVIPDAQAKRIIDDVMVPPFRQGKYAAGLIAALERIQVRIVGEQKIAAAPVHASGTPQPMSALPPGVDQFARAPSFEMGSGLMSLLVLMGAFAVVIMLSKLFGWNKNATPPVRDDDDEDTPSPTSSSNYSGSSDPNAMHGGGGDSAGGGATSSFDDASSSSGDSGSSDSGSSVSSSSDSSDSNRS
jgi:uncharacterized membrane protein YgcG